MQAIDYTYSVTANGKTATRRATLEFLNTDPVPNISRMIERWNKGLEDWAKEAELSYCLVSVEGPYTVPGTAPLV